VSFPRTLEPGPLDPEKSMQTLRPDHTANNNKRYINTQTWNYESITSGAHEPTLLCVKMSKACWMEH